MPTAEAAWSVSGRAQASQQPKRRLFYLLGFVLTFFYILDRVMRVRLNLPTAPELHFEPSAVVLVATSCCSMCRTFRPSALLLHLMLCVCQCCQLVFMLVVHTAVLAQYVRVSSYLNRTTTSSKQKEGDMKWHGLWPHRSEHSGKVRCESTALVDAYSGGCLKCQRPCSSQGQRPKSGFSTCLVLSRDSVT